MRNWRSTNLYFLINLYVKNTLPQVKDKSLYPRIVNHGPLGLGEGYMDGQWECEDISAMAFNLFHGDALAVVNWFHPWNRFLNYMSCSYFNLQSQSRSWEVGEKHYDLGNLWPQKGLI